MFKEPSCLVDIIKAPKEIKCLANELFLSDCLLKKPGLLLSNEEGLEGGDKEGEGCLLSNGDSTHSLPEKQSWHDEVRQSETKTPSGAVDIPKAHAKTKHSSKGSPLIDGCGKAPKEIKCVAKELFRSDCLFLKPGLLLSNEEELEGGDKEGEGCLLSNGDSTHLLPEKQSLHGEVRQADSKTPSVPVEFPKAYAKTKHSSKGSS